MKMLRKQLVTLTAAASMAMPLTAMATNGMNAEGTGAKNRGMGGAGVALAIESASVTNNPAAAVLAGNRWDVALGLFDPSPRGYTLDGQPADINPGAPGDNNFNSSQTSSDDTFLIPFFGMVSPIDDKSSWAFVMNANGGMNTEYATNFGSKFGQSGPTGVNLAQLFVNGTYARKLTDSFSVGFTAIYAYQTFEAKGLGAFGQATVDSKNLTDNGEDTSDGAGFKVGAHFNMGEGLSLGVAYQHKITMTKFSKYKGLFQNGGSLDIAPTYSVGLAYVASPALTFAFDYLYIDYNQVDTISNATSLYKNTNPGTPCGTDAADVCFGGANGPGFGWKSINVYKLGAQYAMSPTFTLRAGWNHGESPVQNDDISMAFLVPGVTKDHATVGFTMGISKTSEFTFNYVKSLEAKQSGPFSPSFGGGTMTVGMEQSFFEFGYASHF